MVRVEGDTMVLRDAVDGRELALTVTGYELADPDPDDDWHDVNWLNLSVTEKSQGGVRTGGPDACLLTTEGLELVQWLRQATVAGGAPSEITFLEPELSLGVDSEDAHLSVRVTLQYGLSGAFGGGPASLDPLSSTYRLSHESLRAAADRLEAELQRFPVRGDGP